MEIQYTAKTSLAKYYDLWRFSLYGCVFEKNKNPIPGKTLQNPMFQKPIESVEPWEIDSFLHYELNNGMSMGSVQRYRTVLNRVFEMALMNGVVQKNPCELVKTLPRRAPEHRMFSKSELDAIMNCLKYRPEGNIYALIRYTGLFWQEATLLKWGDVDFDRKELYVRKESFDEKLAQYEKYRKYRINTGDERTIPLCSDAVELLNCEKKLQFRRFDMVRRCRSSSKTLDVSGSDFDAVQGPDCPVFSDNFGNPYADGDRYRMNKWMQEQTGIVDLGSDRLRIHFNMELIQCGVDMKTMSEIAGLQCSKSSFHYFMSNEKLQAMKKIRG